MSIKLQSIKKSEHPEKKYVAEFSITSAKTNTKTKKRIHFGANGMGDYIKFSKMSNKTGDEHKERYLNRHKKREDWNNPLTAGALSRWVLWNKRSLRESISDFKSRFNL